LLVALCWYVGGENLTVSALLWLHGIFGLVLLLTLRWWWREAAALTMLIVINHIATFLSGGILVSLFH
jgi:hypothetical protein